MLNTIYTKVLKLLQQELAGPTAPDPEELQVVQPARTAPVQPKNDASQIAGIDVSSDQLHMTDGRIFEITSYADPYGKPCEPEDACAVEAFNGNHKIKVEFYSTRYTLH
jgi:hypothetical protein